MTALEYGFLAGLLLCTGLYGFLLREFRRVYVQQLQLAHELRKWKASLTALSDEVEDQTVKMVSVLLEEKAE